jgi:hypothetical protein
MLQAVSIVFTIDIVVSCRQGHSQTVTGVTVLMGAQGAPGDPGKDPQGAPRGPRKGPRKEAAQERAVKAKISAICFLEKRRK